MRGLPAVACDPRAYGLLGIQPRRAGRARVIRLPGAHAPRRTMGSYAEAAASALSTGKGVSRRYHSASSAA